MSDDEDHWHLEGLIAVLFFFCLGVSSLQEDEPVLCQDPVDTVHIHEEAMIKCRLKPKMLPRKPKISTLKRELKKIGDELPYEMKVNVSLIDFYSKQMETSLSSVALLGQVRFVFITPSLLHC